jgi:hypothetical protein
MTIERQEEHDFADIVREFAHGSTNQVATQRLREVVKACRETGAKGSITLKLAIDSKQGIAEIKASLSVKKPEPALPGQCFYTTDDGALVDEDPRQMKLPTKVIDAPAQLKTLNGGNVK